MKRHSWVLLCALCAPVLALSQDDVEQRMAASLSAKLHQPVSALQPVHALPPVPTSRGPRT